MKSRPPLIHILTVLAFLTNVFGPIPLVQADEFRLPAPGAMVNLSPEFNPPMLKGIKVRTDNPFHFDFILDKGDSELNSDQLKNESSKLIKYFLASLTIPEKDLWVNLSPYEKDRIIPQSFGLTEMGRDLLAEDYMLKQITASLIYPDGETGKKFWKRIYEEAEKKFGTTNIPVNTFNKVWIVPEKAVVYENAKAGTAYVVESRLKVMLEQDYLALNKNMEIKHISQSKQWDQLVAPEVSTLGSQIVREIVIPQLTREINEDKNFSHLRQVYNSLILATWYKKKIKDSILSQVYADKNKTFGVQYTTTVIPARAGIQFKDDVEGLYLEYLKAFKKGVYNYIKDELDPATQQIIPRKYFSGGMDLALLATDLGKTNLQIIKDPAMVNLLNPNADIITTDFKPSDSAMRVAMVDVGNGVSYREASEQNGFLRNAWITTPSGTIRLERKRSGKFSYVFNAYFNDRIISADNTQEPIAFDINGDELSDLRFYLKEQGQGLGTAVLNWIESYAYRQGSRQLSNVETTNPDMLWLSDQLLQQTALMKVAVRPPQSFNFGPELERTQKEFLGKVKYVNVLNSGSVYTDSTKEIFGVLGFDNTSTLDSFQLKGVPEKFIVHETKHTDDLNRNYEVVGNNSDRRFSVAVTDGIKIRFSDNEGKKHSTRLTLAYVVISGRLKIPPGKVRFIKPGDSTPLGPSAGTQAGDSAMSVRSGITSIILSNLEGHDPENLRKFLVEYLKIGSFSALNREEWGLTDPIRTISRIVQRRLYESYISENNFRDFIRVNMEEVIHLRERGLVLDRIRLSSRRNTTEPLLLESVKKIDQWLEFPLSNLGLGKFEFELEKIGFWGMNVNRQIKDGIAKEFLWFLDKVDRENIRGKEQWEEAILRTAWELELLGDNKSEVQIMFRRELKTRGYNVERIESVLKEIPLSATKPQGEAIPLLKRTVQEIREWDVYNVTGRNWYWDFWPPGRRQIIKDRLEILLEKDHFVQFVKELAAKLYPSSEVRAIIVGGSYLYGYTELKGRDIDSTVILSNSTGNAPEFAHQLFTKDSLDKLNLASRFSLPEDYLRKVTDFDFIFRTEQGIRDQDLAYLWGSGITIYGEDFADRKPDQRILLRDALHLLENGIKKMWDYPMAPKSDVDYMFGKIVKRLTEASFELKQLFPDEASQLSNADYYPQLVTSYYQALIEQKGKDREDRKIEKEFLRGIASTYMQRLDYIKTKIDAITDPDERWDDYISMAHIIRGIDRVSNYGDHDTLPVLYQDIHGLMKSMTGNRLKEAVQDKTQDNAMATVPLRKTGAIRDTGGIDLTPANMNLQTQNNGGAIKFHLDPAILQQLQNASGFVPVIINIQPMNNLKMFLGLADN